MESGKWQVSKVKKKVSWIELQIANVSVQFRWGKGEGEAGKEEEEEEEEGGEEVVVGGEVEGEEGEEEEEEEG